MSDERQILRENIKLLRQELDISQEELSEMCNYSSTYIGKIERGDRSPSLDTLARIAHALNVPLLSLFDPVEQQLNQLDGWEDEFSPYDLMIRRFHYLIGEMDAEGSLRYLRSLPWFTTDGSRVSVQGQSLWENDRCEFTKRLQEALREAVAAAANDEPTHLSLAMSEPQSASDLVDCVIYPLTENDSRTETDLGFELFWPRIVREGKSLRLDDVVFDLAVD